MSVTVVYRSAKDLEKAEYWYNEGPKLQARVDILHKVAEAAVRCVSDWDCPTLADIADDDYDAVNGTYTHECFDRDACPDCEMFNLGLAVAEYLAWKEIKYDF